MHDTTFKCVFIIVLNILPTVCKMSARNCKSGAQKSKIIQRAEEELRKLTKLESFLTKIDFLSTFVLLNKPKASTTVSL